jgi:transposase
MTGLNYVTRRGAIYIWRRRLPARVCATSYLQISLRTAKFSTAKILANLVNTGFEACSERMKSKRITKAEAQRFLADLVARNLEQIEEERYCEPEPTTPEDWRERYFQEKCRAIAYRLVASRGRAADLLREDVIDLKTEGFSEDHLAQIRREISDLREEIASETYQAESQTLAQHDLARQECAAEDLRAVGALRMAAKAEALERSDRRKATTPYLNLDLDALPRPESKRPRVEREAPKGRYSDELPQLVSDFIGARALLSGLPDVDWLLGDQGHDADWFKEALEDKEIRTCIPGRKQRKTAIRYDKRRYKRRNRIEIMFGRLKDWRRVATRYDRCPKVFLSAIALAALVIYWLCVLTPGRSWKHPRRAVGFHIQAFRQIL